MARGDFGGTTRTDRRPLVMTDQHDRPWFAHISNKSGAPIGLMTPQFTAPWTPDQSKFVFDNNNPTRFRIDYELMIEERLEAKREYRDAVVDFCVQHKQRIPEEHEAPDAVIIREVGRPPNPVEIPLAASQGNPWILGLTTKPDPRLTPFIANRHQRAQAQRAGLPDFSQPVDEEFEELMDLEESVDPDAIGGKKANPRKRTRAA